MNLGTRLGHGPAVLEAIAGKVLHGHLQNRDQLLDVVPTDLTGLPTEEADVLVRAMIAAAHADGQMDQGERRRVTAAMASAGLALDDQLDQPQCLETLVRGVTSPQQATRFYGASVIAMGKGSPIGRAYLAYLAQRLSLPADQVVRLNRRLGMPR